MSKSANYLDILFDFFNDPEDWPYLISFDAERLGIDEITFKSSIEEGIFFLFKSPRTVVGVFKHGKNNYWVFGTIGDFRRINVSISEVFNILSEYPKGN